VSSDGTLYFQSVTRDDVGDYYCMVTRPDAQDSDPEGKVSEPIPLEVTEAGQLVAMLTFLNTNILFLQRIAHNADRCNSQKNSVHLSVCHIPIFYPDE